ncbi:hypothetical protein [Brevundimonas sp. DC300-4]|uniref:hypothetical protein n=1 Tax=Brevundimonas sp. DC300-4 TaxID=2804594 RepID=UPI003CF256AB
MGADPVRALIDAGNQSFQVFGSNGSTSDEAQKIDGRRECAVKPGVGDHQGPHEPTERIKRIDQAFDLDRRTTGQHFVDEGVKGPQLLSRWLSMRIRCHLDDLGDGCVDRLW